MTLLQHFLKTVRMADEALSEHDLSYRRSGQEVWDWEQRGLENASPYDAQKEASSLRYQKAFLKEDGEDDDVDAAILVV